MDIPSPFKKLSLVCAFIFCFSYFAIPLYCADANGGIGAILEYQPDKKVHRIRAVFQGSPAAKAHLQPGEEIISIDGVSTQNMSFEELGRRVRGAPGTSLRLTLRSPSTGQNREVVLTRIDPRSLSPLIVGSTPQNKRSTLNSQEMEQVKTIIRQLKTPEQRSKMEQLLLNLRDGKISKPDFLNKIHSEF